ncbi:MAG: hypothetical protein ACD_20C00238G0003 [uncultured bacterium]|nr:MAG: hypothetical protein ACD_20C00238G0003 [uncultured bacterium]HBH19278.1 hypothetical protein [Cyanobacteria bacterium UBA9579]
MSDSVFEDQVREKAYYNYLSRVNQGLPGDANQDWYNAEREQKIEEKIKEEAYYHYLTYGDYPLLNWLVARTEITERLQFLAFYMHEANINKSPIENWIDAQNLYIEKF